MVLLTAHAHMALLIGGSLFTFSPSLAYVRQFLIRRPYWEGGGGEGGLHIPYPSNPGAKYPVSR